MVADSKRRQALVHSGWLWLTDPKNNQTVAGLSFILGAAGFAITLAGFALAYWRIRRLETAADAAAAAVRDFKLRIVQYDAANDASEARYALLSARRHLNNDGWRDVAESFEDGRRAILRMMPSFATIDPELHKDVEKFTSHASKVCLIIDKGLNDPSKPFPDKAGLNSSLRKHLDTIQRVQSILQQKAS
jgi:hypothetical protein